MVLGATLTRRFVGGLRSRGWDVLEESVTKSEDLKMLNRGWVGTLLTCLFVLGATSGVSAQFQGSTQIDLNQFRPAELATDDRPSSRKSEQSGATHP